MLLDKGLTPAICSRMAVNYVPTPVRLEFNGERILSREYVLADIFDLQRHLFRIDFYDLCLLISTSPAGSLLAVKLHPENGKYKILISLIHQWQDNPRKTMRNQ